LVWRRERVMVVGESEEGVGLCGGKGGGGGVAALVQRPDRVLFLPGRAEKAAYLTHQSSFIEIE
jgi:hypothetical protein